MVTVMALYTRLVVTLNVAVLLPLGTVTVAGTPTADELSLSEITAPPLGAGPLNFTVPWEEVPPLTVLGVSESELNTSADETEIVAVATLLLFVPSFA
jgi:hypothetical protein